MKGKKITVLAITCLMAFSTIVQGSIWSLKAVSNQVVAEVEGDQIIIGNDLISRTYQIDDEQHVSTKEIINKRIDQTLHPANGSADFYLNTIYKQETESDIVLPTKELSRTNWTGQLSSADGGSVNTNIKNILDGDDATEIDFNSGKKFPFHFQIDLGSTQDVRSFSYQKRAGNANQAWGINGTIGKYELFVSDDGKNWTPAGKGEFTKEDYNLHTIDRNGTTIYNVADLVYGNFDQTYSTRYIRLDMLSGALSDDISFTGSGFHLYEDAYQGIEKPETTISSSDLVLDHANVEASETGKGKKVELDYEPYLLNGVTWNFSYITVIEPDDHFMRSYVEVTTDDEANAIIDFIELDHFALDDDVKDVWTHPNFNVTSSAYSFPGYEFMLGQPIYADGMFFGSEFPATDTQVIDDTMQIRYYSGKSISQMREEQRLTRDGKFVTWPNVIGAAKGTPSDVIQTDFFAYIDTIATQTDFRKQYNSWYDNRMGIDDASISNTFFATEKGLSESGVEPLDAYVVDDGWNNYNDPEFTGIDVTRSGTEYNQTGFWEFNSKFPNELYPANEMASKFASSFGLWLGPQGGYELQGTFAQYIGKSGTSYVHPSAALGNVICTGSQKYIRNLTSLYTDYQARFDIDYWKLDGFASRPCTQSDHDHMTGGYHDMYFTSELWENWTDAFEAMRAQRKAEGKDLFLNATCYVNPSPWILHWVNAVWMQNSGDLESDGTNGGTSSAKMISGRDNIYFKNYKTAQLQFPLKNVYNHDPIYGTSAGVSMTTSEFRNYMMANAVRGTAFWELYFSPSMMNETLWQVSADVLDWAKENAHILEKAKIFGTAPNQRGVYGYSSWDGNEGIISFRNPTSSSKTYTLKMDNAVGVPSDIKMISQMQVLPYKKAMDTKTVSYGDSITVTLAPYETRIYQYGYTAEKPGLVSIKSKNMHTIRMKFDQRISDEVVVNVDGKTPIKTVLMDDYKTVEITVDAALQDVNNVFVDVKNILGDELQRTVSLKAYDDGDINQVKHKQDLNDSDTITEDTYDRNGMNVMNIDKEYKLTSNKGVEGKLDFAVSLTLKTTSNKVGLLNQKGAFSLALDEYGYVYATIGSKEITSKEVKTLVDVKAHGLFGSDAYTPTTIKEVTTGRVNDGRFHTIDLVREVNGMLKLYVDGELRSTVYDRDMINENLLLGTITLGDRNIRAGIANVEIKNNAIGYDEAVKSYTELNMERYQEIDRSEWTADASSEYKKGTNNAEGPAKNAIDGKTNTLWHTDYSKAYPTAIDHWISFDLKKATTFHRFAYTGRVKNTNGNIKDYILQIKNNQGEWCDLTTGTFEDGGTSTVDFDEVTTTGLRLKGVTFYGADPKHAAAVEINVYRDLGEQPDMDILNAFMKQMGELKDATQYTSQSYTVYTLAYEAVIALNDNINLTTAMMNKTLDAYTNAEGSLVSVVAIKLLIADANEYIEDEGKYAPSYIETLKMAVIRAEALCASGTQEEIQQAMNELQELLDHPELDMGEDTVLVKGILKNTITKAENVVKNEAMNTLAPTVQATLRACLADAKAIYEDANASVEAVMNAWTNLANIMQYLDFKADKTELHALILECEKIDLSAYVEGVEAFQTALEHAKTTAADDMALQARIDTVYGELFAAKEGLKASSVDKSSLKQMLAFANTVIGNEAKYANDDNWNAFLVAMEEAEMVFENANATQVEINTAVAKLAAAYENIRLLPDEELLKALADFINVAEEMDATQYSASDYTIVRNTMATAKMMLERPSYTEEEVSVIKEQMAESYAIIENNKLATPVEPEEPSEEGNAVSTPETSTTIKGTTKPATGDKTNMMKYVILLGGAALCTMYAKKHSCK